MKHSYRILGLIWDGMPEYDAAMVSVSRSEMPQRLGVPRNLFELEYLSRSVSCSDVFRLENDSEALRTLNGAQECDEILLDLDGAIGGSGEVASSFYLHRARQVGWYIHRLAPHAKIRLISPDREAA